MLELEGVEVAWQGYEGNINTDARSKAVGLVHVVQATVQVVVVLVLAGDGSSGGVRKRFESLDPGD